MRVAAVAALGQRRGEPEIAAFLEEFAEATASSPTSRASPSSTSRPRPRDPVAGAGLTVAQLFLHADIDADLTQAGSGDNGGIATLLVRLGDALPQRPAADRRGVERVITLSRGSVSGAVESVADIAAREPATRTGVCRC